jgi:protein-tyrosine phosphatase
MKVLFVCSGNAYRSPLAEALLKKMRPDLEVDSAGTFVGIPISEEAKRFLTKNNAEQYLKEEAEDLVSKQLEQYDFIVAMEQRHKDIMLNKCPKCEDKIVVWNIEDPFFVSSKYAEKIFKQIEEKVAELANFL